METAEKQPVETKAPGKRDEYLKKMRERYPDEKFDDDDAIFDRISRDENDRDTRLQRYEEESGKMVNMFRENPKMGTLFNLLKEKGNPVEWLLETFGPEFKEALDDPERRKEFGDKFDKYYDDLAKNKQLSDEADANLQETFGVLQALQDEKGWTDEEALQVFTKAYDIVTDGIQNKISAETFLFVAKALNYDNDVQDAAEQGRLQGRNENIEEKLRKAAPPTAMPNLGGVPTKEMENKPAGPKRKNPFLS